MEKEEKKPGRIIVVKSGRKINYHPLREQRKPITAKGITDKGFLDFCIDEGYVDARGHVLRKKMAAVTAINVNDLDIESLEEGLRFFPALEELRCSGNRLTSLDTSMCPALRLLDCSDNELTRLDVSRNPALAYLDCTWNHLSALDVSQTLRPDNHDLLCGNQCREKAAEKRQTLTLTLSTPQQARWENVGSKKEENYKTELNLV